MSPRRPPPDDLLSAGRIEEIEALTRDPSIPPAAREALLDLLAVRARLLAAIHRAFEETGWCPVCDGHHQFGTLTPCPVREYAGRRAG